VPLSDLLSGWSLDLGTTALLATVLWFEGWRRVPGETILVGRALIGRWHVHAPWAAIGSFVLVAWWSPVMTAVVIPLSTAPATPRPRWTTDFLVATARGRRRLRRVRTTSGLLRTLGVVLIAWIALGIPAATTRFAAAGLAYGILAAIVLAAMMGGLALRGMRALGTGLRVSLRALAPMWSPFAASRASELTTAAAVGELEPLAQVAALMGMDRFLDWIRPWAYDALHAARAGSSGSSTTVAELVRQLPRALLERAVHTHRPAPAGEPADRYCLRCGCGFREQIVTCSDCAGVVLVDRASSPAA
jgi:hypothetical protein